MRFWLRWLGIPALVPVFFAGMIGGALAYPNPFFAYHTERGRLSLYSDKPFDEKKAQAILAHVDARLKTSPLDTNKHHSVFVSNTVAAASVHEHLLSCGR